jgi:DNA-binding FadR family transcriptional regulator
VLNASANPFYMQFRDVVSTALQTSIRFTNRFKGRTASLPAHKAVLDSIADRDPDTAKAEMAAIIREVMVLIADAEAKA